LLFPLLFGTASVVYIYIYNNIYLNKERKRKKEKGKLKKKITLRELCKGKGMETFPDKRREA